MSDSALKMVIASLEGLFERGKITFPQYQAELAAIRKEAREVESSSSPQREAEKSPGVVKTQQEVPVKGMSSSSSTGVIKSQVVDEDTSGVCAESSLSQKRKRDQGAVVETEVKKSKAEERSVDVVESDVHE